MLRQYQEEIKKLKDLLLQRQGQKESIKSHGTASTLQQIEENRLNPMEMLGKIQIEAQNEKQAMLNSKDILEEESKRIGKQLQEHNLELEHEKLEREALANQIRELESKLLFGGEKLEDHVIKQGQHLEEVQKKLKIEKERQQTLLHELQSKQEAQLQLEENYVSMQDEVEVKSKKLKMLWEKLQVAKAEMSDIQDEFRLEKEQLLEDVRDLSRELSWLNTVIENFIPRNEVSAMESRLSFNEKEKCWKIRRPEKSSSALNIEIHERPSLYKNSKHHVCSMVIKSIAVGNAKSRSLFENIMHIHLEESDRSTLKTNAEPLKLPL